MRYPRVFHQVFTLETAIAGAVFAVILGLLIGSVIFRRAGSGRAPSGRTEHHVLEGSYAVVLLGIALFLVIFTERANGRETSRPAAKPQVRVDVTAFQWCWRFRYRTQPVDVTASCNNGSYPTLVVPVGRQVKINLTSTDVIHSFWVPALKFKLDAFPDHSNSFTLKLTRTGEWIGRCAEFCGDQHATMHFHLKAVSAADYASWVHSHHSVTT